MKVKEGPCVDYTVTLERLERGPRRFGFPHLRPSPIMLSILRRSRSVFSCASSPISTRHLSTRVRDVLSRLSLEPFVETRGVYDGLWKGSGETIHTYEAATGDVLGSVRTVSCTYYILCDVVCSLKN
jgi:hypothetical protein